MAIGVLVIAGMPSRLTLMEVVGMTGILKVDQIQLANGNTPTASDLGLNTTGSVLQVKQAIKTDTGTGASSLVR